MNKNSKISNKFQKIIKFYQTLGFLQVIFYGSLFYLGMLVFIEKFFRIAIVLPYFTGLTILIVISISLYSVLVPFSGMNKFDK